MAMALRKLRHQEVITEAVTPVLDTTQPATTPAVCQVPTMDTWVRELITDLVVMTAQFSSRLNAQGCRIHNRSQ